MSAVIEAPAQGWARRRLAASARPFATTASNSGLLRSQLAFGASWTAEAAFGVAIAVVAFRDGGAAAVGLVAFALMAPSAIVVPIGSALGDRFRRDRVLFWSCSSGPAPRSPPLPCSSPAARTSPSMPWPCLHRRLQAVSPDPTPPCCRPLQDTIRAQERQRRSRRPQRAQRAPRPTRSRSCSPQQPATGVRHRSDAFARRGRLLLGLSYQAPPRGLPQPLRRIASETIEGFQALGRHRDAGLLIGLSLVQTLTQGFLNVFVVVLALEELSMETRESAC